MTEFHAPYNFIPTTGKVNGRETPKIPWDQLTVDNAGQVRHDYWSQGLNNGRIVCRLTLLTPTIVGCKQVNEDDNPSPRVEPYRVNGELAIPGSSLRGLVSSIAETLSQSALRVLDNELLSIRRPTSRRKESVGKVHQFFEKISPDLLPWGAQQNNNENRQHSLTPAEAIFGVVAESRELADKGSRNLASRVRFSDAIAAIGAPAPQLMGETLMKILASPKPPSPNMYFRPANGLGAISKDDFKLQDHQPRGRKYYLHHPDAQTKSNYWKTNSETTSPDQKLRVTPIDPKEGKQALWFHVDFENLTNAELDVLRLSLKPSKEFRHKLGLGKPMGLGKVNIAIAGIFLIDRLRRYQDFPVDTLRYHTVLVPTKATLPDRYADEGIVLKNQASAVQARDYDFGLIDADTFKLMIAVGDPGKLKSNTEVRYPYANGQENLETEGFEWFVKNDRSRSPQALGEIATDEALPTLQTSSR